MTLKSKHILPIVLAAFIIGIGGTIAFNLWQTTSSKVPATYTAGEFAGEYNPGDIRGSYSFKDIEEAFSVPVAGLAEAFGVEDSEDPAAFLCKGLEDIYGQVGDGEIGTDSVRWFVALYTGLPYTPEEDTLLPSTALPVLQGRLSEADLAAVEARTVSLAAAAVTPENEETAKEEAVSAPETAAAVEEPDTHTESEAGEIKGKTTFGELQSWGLGKEEIEEVLGLPVGKAGITVRDYCTENGIEFSSVKEALQAAVDRAMAKQ